MEHSWTCPWLLTWAFDITVNAHLVHFQRGLKLISWSLMLRQNEYVLFAHVSKKPYSNHNLIIYISLEIYDKCLGIYQEIFVDKHLKWHQYTDRIRAKIARSIYIPRSTGMRKYIYIMT